MALGIETFTMGVEEEYQIVDPVTRKLAQRQQRVLPAEEALGEAVQPELQLSMIEVATPVCTTLADVREAVVAVRKDVIDAAKANGSRIAAAGTHPFSPWSDQPITPKPRYRGIASEFGQIARDRHLRLPRSRRHPRARDRAGRPQPGARAALPAARTAANSPFWLGEDTGYASYRTEVWSRWPLSGPPLPFASKAEYDATIAGLVDVGIIEDETKIYWDVRPSERFPTVEFRVTDVCTTVNEAVMIAGLVRALARTAYREHVAEAPYETVRHEVLRAAHWQAARFSLDGELIDAERRRKVPAKELVEGYLAGLREALEEAGDYDEVSSLVRDILKDGNGATRQRAVFARSGKLDDVVDYIIEQTEKN
jgi:glutamate---cysteine ligase / carboxylate-amine ligase